MWTRCTCCLLLIESLVLILGSAAYGAFDPLTEPTLIGWWKCDEGDGDKVADSSSKKQDGTFVNGASAWAVGASGSAISLSGDIVVEVPAVNLTLTQATMVGWVLPNGVQSDWASIIMHRPTAHGFNLLGSRQLAYHWNDDAASWSYRGTAYYAADEWTHCALTVEPTKATFYVNGVAICTNTLNHASAQWNSPLWFGGDRTYTGSRHLKGALDDIMFFSRALTAEEIKSLVPPKLKARKPDPADGSLSVSMPLLQWTKGDTAMFHDVYVGTTPQLTAADLVGPHQMFTMLYYVQGLQPGATYYWRVDEIDAAGAVTTGDVWTFVAQALTAYHPSPADGAVGVAQAPALTWLPGQSVLKHHLYFGDSSDTVNQGAATTDKGELTDPSFTPGALEGLTTYYWRVDETPAGGAVRTGPVWKFTTCLSVDDFESYTDDLGSAIFDTWIDGFTNGLSGSTVGYAQAPFAEQTIVHGGKQSMPFDYNNVKSPFYSEAEREFSSAEDWTVNEANDLVLEVRGRIANAATTLYVAVEDASKKVAVVTCPDAAAVTTAKWTEWKIPLKSLTGVNLAKVKKLYIGAGDRKSPTAGGAGRIFVDDIRVTRP